MVSNSDGVPASGDLRVELLDEGTEEWRMGVKSQHDEPIRIGELVIVRKANGEITVRLD